MRIVLIGAASQSFGRGQIVDMLRSPALRGQGVTLWLVDEDAAALDVMTRFAERVKAHVQSDILVRSSTDRRDALPNADYVITAVARKRMALWEQDYRVPLAHGFRHCLGENGGPGALFHALRSLELIIPICLDMETLCPNALLMNFTNPEARVLHAVCHLTRVRAAGFCHGVFSALSAVEHYLQRPVEELEVVSAGMNHFYALLVVRDKATGEDLYPELRRRVLSDTSPRTQPLFRTLVEVFDVFSYPSDDHIGEYLSFGGAALPRWPYGLESRPIGESQRASVIPLEAYADGRQPLDARTLRTTEELTTPIIADILHDRGTQRPAVNVLNTGGYIDNLPRTGAVEVPATVNAAGIHPQHVGALPEPFAAFVRTQFSIIEAVTEAYRTRSRRVLLQALLLDPVVNSVNEAQALLDEMLALQQGYLPTFE